MDPVGHAARGPAHVKAKRQQKQLAAQASSAIQSSESHPDIKPSLTLTQTVSSDPPRYRLHPIALPPFSHSPMNVDEDSDSSDADPHFNPRVPDQLTILPSPNVTPTPDPDDHLLRYTPVTPPPGPSRTLTIPSITAPSPEADPHLLRYTPPPGPSKTVTSPLITAALDILRDIAPQMSAVTRMLDNLDMNKEALDVQALGLVTEGMEAAALLERQLARVASKAQCY